MKERCFLNFVPCTNKTIPTVLKYPDFILKYAGVYLHLCQVQLSCVTCMQGFITLNYEGVRMEINEKRDITAEELYLRF